MSAEPPVENGDAAYDEGEEEWDGEDGDYDDEEDDIEEHAAEIARRIEAQLMADLEAGNAGVEPSAELAAQTECSAAASNPAPPPSSLEPLHLSTKEEAATVHTVRTILALLEHDTVAKGAFSVTPVAEQGTLLEILQRISSTGRIPTGTALAVSHAVVTMAKSETLFSSLRQSEAPTTLLKRKRESAAADDEPVNKRSHLNPHPIHAELATAVRVISYTLPAGRALEPSLVLSVKHHILGVFRFAQSIVASQLVQQTRDALTEVGGFLQVIGVLNGIAFDQPLADPTRDTTLHPCLAEGCKGNRFFVRHLGLRGHEQGYHKKPAGTTHAVFKCEGCEKAFPNRDVAQTHRDTAGAGSKCGQAQIVETTITLITEPPLPPLTDADREEVDAAALGETIMLVVGLHQLLGAHVARALGAPAPAAGATVSAPGVPVPPPVVAKTEETELSALPQPQAAA
ncbi:hypothetical protein HMN09_00734600 [Mycena chlorophos]|uniref:Uncharacterized protein n=1 Tax=Mycena chlorophos TaxID=658473 RepID=A0A8H6W5N5_MYCCL|nr:hypothetical protein HMN09_00734600 [Mycena chlorophos]